MENKNTVTISKNKKGELKVKLFYNGESHINIEKYTNDFNIIYNIIKNNILSLNSVVFELYEKKWKTNYYCVTVNIDYEKNFKNIYNSKLEGMSSKIAEELNNRYFVNSNNRNQETGLYVVAVEVVNKGGKIK